MDPDGRNAELFASGQRNTYDIAFNPDGDVVGVRQRHGMGLGERRGIAPSEFITSSAAGTKGSREGSAKWPEEYPDSLPCGSQCRHRVADRRAVRNGRKISGTLSTRVLRVGLVLWTHLGAVHLTPSGASYTGVFEPFVTGKPLNVTESRSRSGRRHVFYHRPGAGPRLACIE